MKKRSVIFNTNLVYFIIITLFVGVRICTAMNAFSFLGAAEDIVLSLVVQFGLLFLLPLLLISKLNKKSAQDTLDDFGFKKIGFKTVLISIGLGLVVFVLNIIVSSFFSYILGLLGYAPGSSVATTASWVNFILVFLETAILPAICEEFTHRGMLVSGYKTLGLKRAIIYSGLMFGLMHLNIGQFFYASITGMILAAVVLFSRSIIPAIIIHFINNGLSVYLDFAEAMNLPGGNLFNSLSTFFANGNIFMSILFIILTVTLLVILLFYFLSALLKINAKKSVQKYAEAVAIQEMRREVLGDIQDENVNQKIESEQPMPPIILVKNKFKNGVKVNIPYEALGFYITPQVKPTKLDNTFFYSTLLLGSLITIFTFIWGSI